MTTPEFKFAYTPYHQFPLRLHPDLADELDRISKRTRMNKTTICRISLEKFLNEIQQSGADALVDEMCAV